MSVSWPILHLNIFTIFTIFHPFAQKLDCVRKFDQTSETVQTIQSLIDVSEKCQ